jgi:hypothetical protein
LGADTITTTGSARRIDRQDRRRIVFYLTGPDQPGAWLNLSPDVNHAGATAEAIDRASYLRLLEIGARAWRAERGA